MRIGSSRIGFQWTPSGETIPTIRFKGRLGCPEANALYRSSGGVLGLVSRKTMKLWLPKPSQMMLFCFDPLNSTSPREGLVQVRPSRLST